MIKRLSKCEYRFNLPEKQIANMPLEKRDESKLLVFEYGKVVHGNKFKDITNFLKEGDLLVLNETKVLPVRLIGQKSTGANCEILLLSECEGEKTENIMVANNKSYADLAVKVDEVCMNKNKVQNELEKTEKNMVFSSFKIYNAVVKPAKRLKIGDELAIKNNKGEIKLIVRILEEGDYGARKIKIQFNGVFESALSEVGEIPLPHYIKQAEIIKQKINLKERYNTVYSRKTGSSAAPTAGLHFTPKLLEKLSKIGVSVARITLNVGLGTFRPVKEENILKHKMHCEEYEISEDAAKLINDAKASGNRVICVGTTSLRAVESNAKGGNIYTNNKLDYDEAKLEHKNFLIDDRIDFKKENLLIGNENDLKNKTDLIKAGKFSTEIFIHNDFDFKVADGLITNFHLPESTLIMLVSAFVGYENCMQIYNEAIKNDYRFYSFGDSSLLFR